MLSLLKDLPDWMVGTMLAGGVWFAGSYAVLAPRAMERDMVQDIRPACVLQLEKEQDEHVAIAKQEAQDKADYAKRQAMQLIQDKERELNALAGKLNAYEMVAKTLGDIPLPMPNMLPPPPVSRQQLTKAYELLNAQKRKLNQIIPIDIPRVDMHALRETCTCAALQAASGKRMSYAISLASFRIIAADELTSIKQDMEHALNLNACKA